MDKNSWLKKGREAIIDLCQLYSDYVTQDWFVNSYLGAKDNDGNSVNIAWRLSLSAFFDIEALGADAEKVAAVYEKSPGLKGGDVLRQKLYAFMDGYILEILEGYDRYIIDQDEYCNGSCPVCLDEYLQCEYLGDLLGITLCRLDEQQTYFKKTLMEEGSEAMLQRNAKSIFTVDSFYSAIEGIGVDLPCEFIEKMAEMVRKDAIISRILNWSEGRNVRLAVESGTFSEMLDRFCAEIVGDYHRW